MTEDTHEDEGGLLEEVEAEITEAEAGREEADLGDERTVYELGYHLVPSLSEEEVALRVENFKKAIEAFPGEFIASGGPLSQELSYPMRKMKNGKWREFTRSQFGWIKFAAAPEKVHAWRDILREDETIIRCIIIKTVREDTMAAHPLFTEVRGDTRPKERLTDAPAEDAKPVSEEELDKRLGEILEEGVVVETKV